ncbi:MAG: DUF434 domain-containing protein, partial [Bacteroidota bacterium]
SWLLSRGYSEKSGLKLVGDRYRLNMRQRKALLRASCPDEARTGRAAKCVNRQALQDEALAIDGYNLLITIESALGGGMIFHCRDGCYRDIASVHGTYRKVEETLPALTMIGVTLQKLAVSAVTWYLDRPVSNSGRLKGIMYELSNQYDFGWQIELVNNPDRTLAETKDSIVVSSDGWVLDHSDKWYNLHRSIVDTIPTASVVKLLGTS